MKNCTVIITFKVPDSFTKDNIKERLNLTLRRSWSMEDISIENLLIGQNLINIETELDGSGKYE